MGAAQAAGGTHPMDYLWVRVMSCSCLWTQDWFHLVASTALGDDCNNKRAFTWPALFGEVVAVKVGGFLQNVGLKCPGLLSTLTVTMSP